MNLTCYIDNHMINGTKLLNVAGMTRGRRDGILKSEKIRHVVKIGPMHLKGVWYVPQPRSTGPLYGSLTTCRIPYDRALEFANKEKITDLLYPLFVNNIGTLLYHPTNRPQAEMVVQESQNRRLETPHARTPQDSQPSSLQHHPMQAHMPSHMSQPPHTRPNMERAHTFPTPPASASSLMSVTGQGSPYEWGSQGMGSSIHNAPPLSIDTGLSSNTRSLPATPATTPPSNIHGISSYQGHSGYDGSKPYYSAAPPLHSQYAAQPPLAQPGVTAYNHAYMKNDMAAPAGRTPPGGQSDTETADAKSDRYSHANGPVPNGPGESVSPPDSDYMHDPAYTAHRGSYTYAPNPSVGALSGEHTLAPELTGSPSQHSASGRMSARSNRGAAPQWTPPEYATPPKTATSSLYNIVSDTRGTAANGGPADTYSAAPTYSTGIGSSLGTKRLRDEDSDDRVVRPLSRGADFDSKRRRTFTDSALGGAPLTLQPMAVGGIMSHHR